MCHKQPAHSGSDIQLTDRVALDDNGSSSVPGGVGANQP